jgi:hypothetical protein
VEVDEEALVRFGFPRVADLLRWMPMPMPVLRKKEEGGEIEKDVLG